MKATMNGWTRGKVEAGRELATVTPNGKLIVRGKIESVTSGERGKLSVMIGGKKRSLTGSRSIWTR
jgi:hypothetical protein